MSKKRFSFSLKRTVFYGWCVDGVPFPVAGLLHVESGWGVVAGTDVGPGTVGGAGLSVEVGGRRVVEVGCAAGFAGGRRPGDAEVEEILFTRGDEEGVLSPKTVDEILVVLSADLQQAVVECDGQPLDIGRFHECAARGKDAVGHEEARLLFRCHGVGRRMSHQGKGGSRYDVPVIEVRHGAVYPF